MFDGLEIRSPKRNKAEQTGWEGFFPYYAGYPETFARGILNTAGVARGSVVCDPWNGSGTTTYVASALGVSSVGLDINPVMIVVARARLLPPSEADSIEPIARQLLSSVKRSRLRLDDDDALRTWFADETSAAIRSVEAGIRGQLVGAMTLNSQGTNLDRLSGRAAAFYVALFAVCRELAAPYRSSNPTWIRRPASGEGKVHVTRAEIATRFLANVTAMAEALAKHSHSPVPNDAATEVRLADSTKAGIAATSTDLVLTSPPYCTRIDYAAAARIELAVLDALSPSNERDLARQMIGSTRVSNVHVDPSPSWGPRCATFLKAVREHPSKASGGYYLKTHLDYFDKMERSIDGMAKALKPGGAAILVVQDSYYKDVHNDLPAIITDICEVHGLALRRKQAFHFRRSMSGINPHSRTYKRHAGAVENVLCFSKI